MINTAKEAENSICPTIIIPILANNGRYFRVRTLLDSGSGTNWISRDVLKKVKHTVKSRNILRVSTFNGEVNQRFTLVEIYIHDDKGKIRNIMCYVQDNYTAHMTAEGIIPHILYNHTTPYNLSSPLADPNSLEVDHTEAANLVGLILCSATTNTLRTNEPVTLLPEIKMLLEPTIFGTAISGAIPKVLKSSHQRLTAHNIAIVPVSDLRDPQLFLSEEDVTLAEDISFLWKQEQIGVIQKEQNIDDKKAWDHFINNIQRDEVTGQFTVRLPFNDKKYMLTDNISMAAARTHRQLQCMVRNKEYGAACRDAKKELDDNDYIELVNPSEPTGEIVYYLPFRAIIKNESDTTKVRLVMDATAKPSASHISLNQALYQGPNLIVDLAYILLRFMLGKYAAIADLEKAFLRILIATCDRDALRFFWPIDTTDINSKLIVYRFKAVMFGSAASPFQLAAVLHVLIQNDCQNKHVQHALQTRIYVDDVTYADEQEDGIVEFFDVSTKTFQKGSFNLRQWASNSPKLMDKARHKGIANESKKVKVLGMHWDINTDRYHFNSDFKWNGKYTKRSVLSFCNRTFDPLGLLVPIIIRLRLFLSTLWELGFTWDQDFSHREDLKNKWNHLIEEALIAVKASKPRQVTWESNTEIHIFADASKDGSGTVVYTRTPPSSLHPQGEIHLVCAKGKVAPLEPKLTIPRLELTGVVLAAIKVPYMIKAWEIQRDVKFFIWSDAKVVLNWISQFNIKDTYVNNRVNTIRKLCKPVKDNIQFRYVPTKDNPADIITRQQDATQFVGNDVWWNGPQWLLNEADWPKVETQYNLYPVQLEESIQNATPLIDIFDTSLLKFFKTGNFSTNLVRMARVLRFIANNSKRRSNTITSFKTRTFSKEELDQAKLRAIQIMQKEMFATEHNMLITNQDITTGPYMKWGLHITPDGIIRCRDRTIRLDGQTINPILVHGQHPFVESFIKYKHVHSNCSSKQYTLHVVRKEVHGPSLTTTINKIVRECNICRILRAAPYAYPQAPMLPMARLAAERPFAVCGVDYSGPHYIKEGRARKKVWIALFTCMVSRAIHIETVPDLSAETFLQALQAMSWNRGTPKSILSDNATCFTKADKILKELCENRQLQEELAVKGITWSFTPVRAPWFGAIYERLIGTLKKELIKLVGHALLTLHELNFCLAQVQGVINNRPLIQVGEDQVISPMNILTGRSDNNEDILNVIDSQEILQNAVDIRSDIPTIYYQTSQRLSHFWQVFQSQYLNSIRFTNNKKQANSKSLTPKVGDLVIVHSHDPRLKWRKAIILETIPSEDGLIRRCKIKTSTGHTIRAVKHLYPLEINVETFIDKIREEKWPETNDFEGFENDLPSNREDKLNKLRQQIQNLNEQNTQDSE